MERRRTFGSLRSATATETAHHAESASASSPGIGSPASSFSVTLSQATAPKTATPPARAMLSFHPIIVASQGVTHGLIVPPTLHPVFITPPANAPRGPPSRTAAVQHGPSHTPTPTIANPKQISV